MSRIAGFINFNQNDKKSFFLTKMLKAMQSTVSLKKNKFLSDYFSIGYIGSDKKSFFKILRSNMYH